MRQQETGRVVVMVLVLGGGCTCTTMGMWILARNRPGWPGGAWHCCSRTCVLAPTRSISQDNGVDCSDSKRPGEEHGGAGDAHRSVVNGSVPLPCTGGEVSSKSEPVAVSNGVAAPVEPALIGNGGGGGGAKKRRGGPAVLMEGSRCSRVNGRGWRCSQPTLVGYALCEHHLGKGRMRSVTGGGGRGGASQLGRTEHRSVTARIPAAVTPPPKADEPGLT